MKLRPLGFACAVAAMFLGVQGCNSDSHNGTGGPSPVPTGLSITAAGTLTAAGQTIQLAALVAYSNHINQITSTGVQWTSLDPSIATVSTSGLLTATGGLGTVNIQATFLTFTATKLMTVLFAASRLDVTGATAFANVGQSSQLTATATFVNGSTRDVTSFTTWTSLDSSVVTVSPAGLVSASGLGATQVEAQYPSGPVANTPTYQLVTVTPPGTFIAWGGVRNPGHGYVSGFSIVDTQSGRTAVTRSDGVYSLAGLTGSAHLLFDKTGFEPVELTITGNAGTVVDGTVAVQPVIRVSPGQTVQTTIAPNDLAYDVSATEHCTRCKMMRFASPGSGTLHLQLAWNRPAVSLKAWVAGQPSSSSSGGSMTVDANVDGGEVIVYFSAASGTIQPGDVLTLTVTASWSLAALPPIR